MSTGDLSGNVSRLLRELKAIKYPSDVDEIGLRLGDPVAFLPLLSFALLKFSRHVARFIVRNGFELAGKTDHRFIESSFKLFRDLLNVRTVLTAGQFFEQGYAERKVLLVCDVIAVCKKLHNDEVRQERLAALKASRQDNVGSKLATPAARKSPVVKVVRNGDVEVHQVLAPQHLPNASDGAQSVYRTTKTVARARSPSPSPSGPSASGKKGLRPPSPLSSQLGAHSQDSRELTFRPTATAQAGSAAAQRQAAASRGLPQRTGQPIHTWFMNPAFDSPEEGGGADLELGSSFAFSGPGRPDSSAWWQSDSFLADQQGAAPWQQGTFTGAAHSGPVQSGQPSGSAGGTSSSAANVQQHTGGPPGAPWLAARQPAATAARQLAQNPFLAPMQVPSVPTRPNGAASFAPATSGAQTASSNAAFVQRELDEWSFSKYFGPGKIALQGHGRGQREDGDSDDSRATGSAAPGQGGNALGPSPQPEAAGQATASDEDAADMGDRIRHGQHTGRDLDRDGPEPDQDRRTASPKPGPPSSANGNAYQPQQLVQQSHVYGQLHRETALVQPGVAGAGAGAGDSAASAAAVACGSGGREAELRAKLEQLEGDTQQQLRQLEARLAAAEEELEKCRSEAKQSREALQARVTVLEGRVRFLECELEVCVKRQPGSEPAEQHSPGLRPPSPAVAQEPSVAAWQTTERPRSAGATLQAPSSGLSLGPRLQAPGSASQQQQHGARVGSSRPESPGVAGFGQHAPGHGQVLGHDQGPVRQSWDCQAAPALSDGAAGPNPHSAGAVAATGGATSHAGNPGHRVQQSFSPMPQPSFLFQPRSLMQQVASASAGGAQPPQAQPASAAGATGGPSGSTFAGQAWASADSRLPTTTPGMHGGADQARSSLPAHGQANPSWRPSDRLGARGPGAGSILDGVGGMGVAHAGQHGGRGAVGSTPQLQPDSARLSERAGYGAHRSYTADAAGAARTTTVSAGMDATASSHAYITPGGQPGGGSALPGPGTAGSAGGFRNTDDLINSLYSRYAEAQDFLQTLRRH